MVCENQSRNQSVSVFVRETFTCKVNAETLLVPLTCSQHVEHKKASHSNLENVFLA